MTVEIMIEELKRRFDPDDKVAHVELVITDAVDGTRTSF